MHNYSNANKEIANLILKFYVFLIDSSDSHRQEGGGKAMQHSLLISQAVR